MRYPHELKDEKYMEALNRLQISALSRASDEGQQSTFHQIGGHHDTRGA